MRQICVRRVATMCARAGVKIPPRALKREAQVIGSSLLHADAPAPIFGFKNLAGTNFQLLRLQQLVLRTCLCNQKAIKRSGGGHTQHTAFNLKLFVLKVICLRKDLCQLIFQRLRRGKQLVRTPTFCAQNL
jgi:hypothetical protein